MNLLLYLILLLLFSIIMCKMSIFIHVWYCCYSHRIVSIGYKDMIIYISFRPKAVRAPPTSKSFSILFFSSIDISVFSSVSISLSTSFSC